MSGVYDVDRLPTFTVKGPRREASPQHYVHRGAPPFLISYCQWDYIGLPKQAREFSASLKKALVETDLMPVPFTEVKLSYRNHDEPPAPKFQEYLVQFFFPF